VVVTALLLIVALIAGFIPARRAAKTDPKIAPHAE
jgi:ABC-type lipoprotein release transport system permease subunit